MEKKFNWSAFIRHGILWLIIGSLVACVITCAVMSAVDMISAGTTELNRSVCRETVLMNPSTGKFETSVLVGEKKRDLSVIYNTTCADFLMHESARLNNTHPAISFIGGLTCIIIVSLIACIILIFISGGVAALIEIIGGWINNGPDVRNADED